MALGIYTSIIYMHILHIYIYIIMYIGFVLKWTSQMVICFIIVNLRRNHWILGFQTNYQKNPSYCDKSGENHDLYLYLYVYLLLLFLLQNI